MLTKLYTITSDFLIENAERRLRATNMFHSKYGKKLINAIYSPQFRQNINKVFDLCYFSLNA